MSQALAKIIGHAEEAVARLIAECRPHGPLHAKNPRIVGQVSRTGKWLLNALSVMRTELTRHSNKENRS